MRAFATWGSLLVMVSVASFLLGMLAHNIAKERRRSGVRKIWKNFGLGLTFAILFLVSWIAQAFAEWQLYVDEGSAHDQPASPSGFLVEFGQSTLENWQSEFLQLFSFVVLAAVLIHRGSAEWKDGTDRIEKTVNEIRTMVEKLRAKDVSSSSR